ncbi:HVO_A0556 family zinc finger protein [Natronorubrum aibiense]|uniref:HVO_A0556 family zinc finger protein n=1 Tax=Natronorubrum aibiense TaxID=348826 RepID=UPI00145707D1|nr:HVO_A0556 family zinc finger protein [Natronorubrum aibiense]
MAKSQSSQAGSDEPRLLTLLAGRSCPYCDEGELERDVYKDNQAVVCDSCETPQAQLW